MPVSQRRSREVLAGNLLFGAFLVSHALFYYGVLVLHRPLFSDQITNPWVTIPVNVLTVGWYYAIRQGKRWAAWLLLVLVGVALAHSLLPHRRAVLLAHMHANGVYAAQLVLGYASQLVALGLLFFKPKQSTALA
jgi:hypothetical protein